jgi:MoaA/NifB/PqqE/SkfB family radical SAM enzyme
MSVPSIAYNYSLSGVLINWFKKIKMFYGKKFEKIRRFGLKGISDIISERFGNFRYQCLMNDITNNCNLRCPFCTKDFSKISKTVFMSKSTFENVLQLLPLVRSGFLFSCGFEPTIHPQFIEYLEKIPDRYKRKAFFTTNLAVPLSEEIIYRLSQLNIYHINISVESFDPFLYESLRRGAQFNIFIDNLERLVHIFSKSTHAPPLRYITMVVRQNVHELPHILELCSKKYLSQENEFRGSFNVPTDDWKKENFLSDEEWAQVERLLEHMPYTYSIKRFDKGRSQRDDLPYIRVNAEGIVTAAINGAKRKYDLNKISDPYVFFKKLAT